MMKSKIYLGFEDEIIVDKYEALLNYTVNKVGGKPNWIQNQEITTPVCKLCGLVLPLIVQVYAPLEKSQYHRTLYVFGCINPNCWNKKESWVCLRQQVLDSTVQKTVTEECDETGNNFDWCDGANVWGDEENGNVAGPVGVEQTSVNEDDLSNRISLLNCNNVSEAKGEVLPAATAEIEDDEDEMVTIDTPLTSHTDLAALLGQVKSIPQMPPEKLEFTSFFINVTEEGQNDELSNFHSNLSLSKARLESNREALNGAVGAMESVEGYEKTVPLHGDKMFHRFITTIQKSPGQILRYIRDGGEPLFLYPADGLPQQCQHCNGDLVFEFQLLPTLVSSLHLLGSGNGHIEFGTVFVLTCKSSCWVPEDIVRTEFVFVQQEV